MTTHQYSFSFTISRDGMIVTTSTETSQELEVVFSKFIKGDPGVGIPTGGTTGQVLKKKSLTDYDMEWSDTENNVNWGQIGGTLANQTDLNTALGGKVDKVSGKGLSTNDYTTAEKTKLAGVQDGAEANVQSDWNKSDSSDDAFIKNKPTALSQFTDDLGSNPTHTHPHDSTKQDVISDLATIRSNASAGKTASDSLGGHTVGKSVPSDAKFTDTVYDDTSIKARVSTIEGKEAGWDGKYTKPNTGIPKSDLASVVQTSLGKADTAIQEHQSLSAYRTASAQDTIDASKQPKIDADHKLPYSLVSGTPTIPTKTSVLENDGDGTNPFLTQHQSLDAYRTAAEQDQIHDSTKQDTISDLADIRTGAAAGATAVQPSAIADMETQTHAGQTYAPITTTYTKTEVDDLLDDKADASDVEAIEAKIPAQATEQNQLADKEFVNSSISTETAHFLGTSQSGLTEAQFLAWANGLENKTNNDYVFWNTTDAASNVQFKKYKYNADTTSWLYEYTLNNSSFTASQWAAISSGITANLVSSYDSHVADSDIHVTTNNKSAWNAKYDKPQNGIPSSDMTQAVQTSLGLADSAYQKPNGGIPSTDMSSAVQTSLGKADTALQQHQDISGKVDKITGKGLSTNDYDNTEKSHVADAFAIVALFNALGLSVVNGKINITYNI